jgi:nicotinamidase-related amidase
MKAALLVVDVQRVYVDELESERRAAFLATLVDLIERARASRTPVIFVRDVGDANGTSVRSDDLHIASEIAPHSGEPVVDKRFRDAFRETVLAATLRDLGVEHVIVCGLHSEFCVDATVREAERRGFTVTLVEDGHVTLPAGGLSEEQICGHVHRVLRGKIAAIVPAVDVARVLENR